MRLEETITSAVGAQVNGVPIFVEGAQRIELQTACPAALFGVQISSDRVTWVAATDLVGAAITNVGNVYAGVLILPVWIRGIVAIDAGGPRDFHWHLIVTMPIS